MDCVLAWEIHEAYEALKGIHVREGQGKSEEEEQVAARGPVPVALVTGANRGIGVEVCRQLGKLGFTVLLGSRDLGKGQRAAQELVKEGLNISPRELDITNQQSIDDLRNSVESEFRVLHVLINNAGILYDTWQSAMEAI